MAKKSAAKSRHDWQRVTTYKGPSEWEFCSRCRLVRRHGDLYGEACVEYLTPHGVMWGTRETAEIHQDLACSKVGR